MRNLKRALSLALAAVMVLGMMVIGASAASYDDFSDKDEIVNKEAVSVLVELGVIAGKDDGTYDPTGIITRAEMAKLICTVLNGGKDPNLGNVVSYTYADTVGHWAAPYIEYCTQLGIVAGDGAGNFNPNATVTGSEAAKMLLVATGYNAKIEGYVGANWAVSTNVLANQNKLYSGLAIDVDAGLTRDNAAQMAYNALNCEMVEYHYALVSGPDGSLTSIPTVDKKDDTLLSDKFGGVRVEGVVVKNEQTSNNFDGKTIIDITNDDELAKVGHDFTTNTSNNATFEVSTDASLLGTSVFFYVVPSVASPTNSEKATVLGSVMDSGKNTVVATNADFGDDTINDYMDAEDIDLATGCKFYVNGSTVSGIANLTAQVNGYEIKFIDNDNDGETEYVVQTTYGFGKVTRYDDASDGGLTIDSLNSSKDYKVKEIVGFEDVAKGDYVIYNEMGGKLYVSVAETVTGTMETFKANGTYYKANLTVDGTTYKFSGGKLDYNSRDGELKDPMDYTNNTAMGKEIVLYLDKFGYVAATSDVKAFTDYAYVANVQTNNDATAMSGAVRVYVVLPDGTEASYIVNNFNNSDTFSAASITVGNVYGYYLTSDGKIDLTSTGIVNNAVATGTVKYTSGDASMTGSSIKVDSSTVFYYAILNSSKTSVKSVEVYGGKDAAPSFEVACGVDLSGVSYVDYDSDGVAEALVVTTEKVSSSNILYLYRYVKSSGEYAIYDAVIDGKIVEGITVDSKATDLAGAPYTYTITSKGAYQLTANPNYTLSGFVTLVDGKSVVVGGKEVKITDSTSMAEIDGTSTAIITGVTKKDYVTVVYDNNDNATGLYIIEAYSTDNASLLDVNKTVLTKSGSAYTTEETNPANVLAALTVSNGASKKIVSGKPADLAAAKSAAAVTSTLTTIGDYYIVIISEDGSSYSATQLLVQSAVTKGTVTIGSTTLEVGYTLTANYTAAGSETVESYQWYKRTGTGPSDYAYEKLTGETASTFVPTAAGDYVVEAVVKEGDRTATTEKSAAVTVAARTNPLTALAIAAGSGSGITADQGNLKNPSPAITGVVGSTAKITFTKTATQSVVIKVGGQELSNNGAETVEFALLDSDIASGKLEISVSVIERGQPDFTATYEVAVTKAKAAQPTALTLVGAQGTGATDVPTVANSGNLLNHSSAAVSVSSAEVGNTLNVTNTPAASTSVSYTIDGAGTDTTNAAYSIVAEDIGSTVTVTVTVTRANYADLVLTYTIDVAA